MGGARVTWPALPAYGSLLTGRATLPAIGGCSIPRMTRIPRRADPRDSVVRSAPGKGLLLPIGGMSVRSNEREETPQLVSRQASKAAARMGRQVGVGVVVTAALAACTNIDAADQKVVDRLSELEVMTVPPGGVVLSRTSTKGGGNIVIRNASG